jgi:hypothetical protein
MTITKLLLNYNYTFFFFFFFFFVLNQKNLVKNFLKHLKKQIFFFFFFFFFFFLNKILNSFLILRDGNVGDLQHRSISRFL